MIRKSFSAFLSYFFDNFYIPYFQIRFFEATFHMKAFLIPVLSDLAQMGVSTTDLTDNRRFSLANLVTAQIEMKRSIGNLSMGLGLKRLSVRTSTRRRLSNTAITPFFIPTMKNTTETTSATSIERESSANLTTQTDPLLCSSAEALFGKQISLNIHNSNLTV